MDVLAILSTVLGVIQTATKVAPIAIKTAQDLRVFAVQFWESITGKAPTAADEAVIDALIASLTIELETLLSPARPGDPDYAP